MTERQKRDLITHAVIALSLCVGGWVVFVNPKVEKARTAEAAVAAARAAQPTLAGADINEIAAPLQGVRERLAEIEVRNEMARDTSGWFAHVSQLAMDAGLEVRGVRPATAPKEDQGASGVLASTLEIRVVGEYAAVGAFIDQLLEQEGFVRARSLSLAPTTIDGEQVLQVRFSGEALSFAVPEELEGFRGGADGDG